MTRKKKRKTRQKSHTPFKLFLLTCFFLSGATSLSLEVSWSKELSYLLGVDIYAAATVVTAFMAGLGLGAVLAARLYKRARASIKTYALLQLVIGVCGVISIPLFRATLPLFSFLYDTLNYSGPLFLTARFLIVFILMLTPVTLMGMTLPVVVGGLFGKVKGRFSSLAGLLYGVNTMGAVTGTLLAGFYLIPEIGILKTCLFTGVVDLLIGVVVFLMDRKGKMIPRPGKIAPTRRGLKTGSPGAPDAPGEAGAVASRLYSWPAVVFMFSGMAALAYEIIWFRLLARVIGPSVHAFSIMLSIYLLGIGLGSITGARWVRKTDKHRPAMAILLFIIAVGPLIPLLFVNHLPVWYGRLFGALSGETFSIWLLVIQGGIASLLILPATFPLGALFPFVTRAYHMEIGREDNRAERTVGRLYFYNTVGGVAGSLLAGFLLLPTLGVKWSLVLACGVSLALSLMIFYTVFNGSWMRKAACCGGILAAVVVFVFSAPDLDHTILNAGMYADML
ncbi:MAG: hypothetical protein GY859_20450, partial [Desulfobacterales bacterium]|nr:hypothetical protein [Desulfobacterales bacterium]